MTESQAKNRSDQRSAISGRCNHAARAGFTIIELLVVTAIIILLLSVLIVAVNAANVTAQKTRTASLMNSISKGLIRFKEDIGYYPPVLGVPAPGNSGAVQLRTLYANSVPNPAQGSYIAQMQEFFSTCTMADYLVGYGGHNEDGYGSTGLNAPFDWGLESPPTGIRHPGPDGAWGATAQTGALADRMKMLTGNNFYSSGTVVSPLPIDQGKVYGPYVELKDERLLAGVVYDSNGQLQTYFKGEALPVGQTWDSMPKAIVDYWGMPIRYYRRPYPPGSLNQSYRQHPSGSGFRTPSLSDVYLLRPQSIKDGAESISNFADADGNTASTRELDAAEFGLVSAGPDKRLNQSATLHADNKDNIVEVGP